jgi:hypothetical protein
MFSDSRRRRLGERQVEILVYGGAATCGEPQDGAAKSSFVKMQFLHDFGYL